jgi:hypothetical protein
MSGKNLNEKINPSAAISWIAFVSFSLFVTDLRATMEKNFLKIKKKSLQLHLLRCNKNKDY